MSNAAINKSENQLILSILDGEGRREEDEDELVDVVAEDADLGEAKQEVEAAHHGAVPAEGASRVRMRTNLVWNKVQLRIEKTFAEFLSTIPRWQGSRFQRDSTGMKPFSSCVM